MKRLIQWFATNPVAANLLMWLIILAGLSSVGRLRQEPFPSVAFDLVAITTVYPGAAPDEVEKAVCVRIEEAIDGVHGVRRIWSRATEGHGVVTVQLQAGSDLSTAVAEIQREVDRLGTLPEEAERPVVQELIDDSVLLSVVLYGDVEERTLRRLSEQVRGELTALPEIRRGELAGVRPYEIAVEVSETNLRRFGLTFDAVVQAVRASSLDLPGGTLRTKTGELLLRTAGQARRSSEFERLALLTRSDGTRLRIGDVARVVEGLADSDQRVWLDGQQAAMVRILTSDTGKGIEASRAVREYVAQAQTRMPEGVRLAIWNDESRALEGRRDLLLRNAGAGAVLVLAMLALFLPWRLALWVSAGVPISFLGALAAMAAFDISINMMSLFAFIVALGLVVDDAIVVGERVARCQAKTVDTERAVVEGTEAVAVPVTIAVLTSVLFLLPGLSLPTAVGKVVYSLALVTIVCLLFSLVESLLILPAHLNRVGGAHRQRLYSPLGFSAALDRVTERRYRPTLAWTLRWPCLTLSLGCVAFMLAVSSLWGGWVRFSFLPEIEADVVTAEVVLPQGTPLEVTESAVRHLEQKALLLRDQLEAGDRGSSRPVFEHVLAAIGDPPDRYDDLKDGSAGAHVGRVRIQLAPGQERTISSLELEDRWRQAVGEIAGASSLRFTGSDVMDEAPINLQLSGLHPESLEAAAETLAERLAAYPGVRDVADSAHGGKQEVKLRIRPEAEAYGLTLAGLARQVRQGFHGEEVQRVVRGRDDVPVVVRYPATQRRSLGDLENMLVRTPDGGAVPFSTVASADLGLGYSVIQRADRRPTINVTADVDLDVTATGEILAELRRRILPEVLAGHPGVSFSLDGVTLNESEMLESLVRQSLLALFAAYLLLAVPLRSYVQPLLVILAIPFGFTGAVAGHAILGLELSGFSLIGVVALMGVVVNDSLVLIDGVNRKRRDGLEPSAAIINSAVTRFRPILLTSLTTFVGLLPLLFERSAQAAWLKPVAVTLAFGIIFATAATLLLVPAMYVVVEQLRSSGARSGCSGAAAQHAPSTAERESVTSSTRRGAGTGG